MSDMHAHQPGEVAWVKCGHPLEEPDSEFKWRPMVLVRRVDGHWLVVGLTTKPCYNDGHERVPVTQPRWAGLRNGRPSYLWGENMVSVSVLDVGDHIGWAALVDQIEEFTRMNAADRASLRRGVASWADNVAPSAHGDAHDTLAVYGSQRRRGEDEQ